MLCNKKIFCKNKNVAKHFILVAILLLFGCTEQEAEEKQIVRPVRYFEIPDLSQFPERSFPGRAQATREVDLAFRVSGPLITFPVSVGDVVKAGDIVARIDPKDFQVALNAAQGRLDNAQAASQRAASEYERELKIFKEDPGATSQTAVDRKKEARDKERANIKSFAAEVEGAKDRLSYTYLKAPFDGNVVKTYVENYEDVLAKEPILRILDDSSIEMIVSIPESLISLAPHAENIKVVFDPFPDVEIDAEITEIGTEASLTTRTYPVTLLMNQPNNVKILPGMAGKAAGSLPEHLAPEGEIGIEIPVAAVFTDKGSSDSFVWLIDKTNLTVSKKQIEIGTLTERGVRVVSGLEQGDLIASAGVHYLFEGQNIKLMDSVAGQ